MRILIVEDESIVARSIEDFCHEILGDRIHSCSVINSLDRAFDFLSNKLIDLLLLDLRLNGENGFQILKRPISHSFHTIVISAYTDQAITAFRYGVFDFVPKPISEKRLKEAFTRYTSRIDEQEMDIKCIAVRVGNIIKLLKLHEITFIKSAGNYVEVNLKNGNFELLLKSMDDLEQQLPTRFFRSHRSYIIDIEQIVSYSHVGGGSYQINLVNGISIPLSRSKVGQLRQILQL